MQIRSTSSIDRAAWIALAALVVSACSSSDEPAPEPICKPLSFSPCETPVGRGVQQCSADGLIYGECSPIFLDAAFPPFDAGGDVSPADGGDEADAKNDPGADATDAVSDEDAVSGEDGGTDGARPDDAGSD